LHSGYLLPADPGKQFELFIRHYEAHQQPICHCLSEKKPGTGRVMANGQSASNTSKDLVAHIAVQGQ
jgi:hypothetical protein